MLRTRGTDRAMSRLFFVVNKLDELNFATFLERHLAECLTDVGTAVPSDPQQYRLIVLWSYRKIVRPILAGAIDLASSEAGAESSIASRHHELKHGLFLVFSVDLQFESFSQQRLHH